MNIRIQHGELHLLDLQTRMPFKYGIAVMTRCPHAFVRLHVEVDGKPVAGIAADHLPPRWFSKNPQQAIEDEIADMRRVILHALRGAADIAADSPFAAWRELWQRQDEWGLAERLPSLLTHFGTSLVERALIEAVCRGGGQPFAGMLHGNGFGMRLGEIHPALAGSEPRDWLPARPLERIVARHTIGMADPLEDSDVTANERLDDGLPQALAACIQAYGLRHFKIKLSGELERDRERLRRIAAVIDRLGPTDYACSVDGNEHFHAVAEFRDFWEALRQTPALQACFAHLLFVEQPLHRDAALDATAGDLTSWADRPAVIIDESDGGLDSLPSALRLGYAGTSHKNCKGVFKGIANACLLAQLRGQGKKVIMSGEDLANIGPVALPQDLAVCASLGVASVERNGHHYFAGLSMFPEPLQRQVLAAHPDLYRPSPRGWPTLAIRAGCVSTQSLVAAPFGVGPVIDVTPFPTVS